MNPVNSQVNKNCEVKFSRGESGEEQVRSSNSARGTAVGKKRK